MVSTLVIHVSTSTTHLPTHKGMEGLIDLLGWPIADTLPSKWSHVNHRLGIDQESPPAEDRCPNHWATPPTNWIHTKEQARYR